MDMMVLIIALSTILWYLIERGKTEIWGGLSYHKWITIGVAALSSFALTFSFGLDILMASGLVETVTMAGKVLTALTLMSGSSAVAEILEKIKS